MNMLNSRFVQRSSEMLQEPHARYEVSSVYAFAN